MKRINLVISLMLCTLFTTSLFAGDKPVDPNNTAELAKESEAYCASTSGTKATQEMIEQKVDDVIALLKAKGVEGYKEMKGKNSKYLFAGTYITIHDFDGISLFHPIKPGIVGKALLNLKDSNGKLFFMEMTTIAKEKGSGWVSYTWPKPGEKTRSIKASYVKKGMINGIPVVVGCGTYDLSDAEVKALTTK